MAKKKEVSEVTGTKEVVKFSEPKISKVTADFGSEQLNKLAEKINEIIDAL